jgi:hypothetical protein
MNITLATRFEDGSVHFESEAEWDSIKQCLSWAIINTSWARGARLPRPVGPFTHEISRHLCIKLDGDWEDANDVARRVNKGELK